jgi:hypothetical protein
VRYNCASRFGSPLDQRKPRKAVYQAQWADGTRPHRKSHAPHHLLRPPLRFIEKNGRHIATLRCNASRTQCWSARRTNLQASLDAMRHKSHRRLSRSGRVGPVVTSHSTRLARGRLPCNRASFHKFELISVTAASAASRHALRMRSSPSAARQFCTGPICASTVPSARPLARKRPSRCHS